MIDRDHQQLSLVRQCILLDVSRASVYYRPVPTRAEDLELMALMDRQYLKTPFYGSRKMKAWLLQQGYLVSRKRVRRLMRLMGLEAIYRRPNTSKPAPGHRIFPYLLKGVEVNRVDQVWAADITYIPMAKGFLYLVAIMDWHSRHVLAWKLSNTMDTSFCVAALEEALGKGRPEIFNTDQGSQFTSEAFTQTLQEQRVQVSMDGKGRYLDNIFVERLWRSIKYEEVYLKAYQTVASRRRSPATRPELGSMPTWGHQQASVDQALWAVPGPQGGEGDQHEVGYERGSSSGSCSGTAIGAWWRPSGSG